MRVFIDGLKEPLRGDLVPLIVLRTDLTPIPSTVELLLRVDSELSPLIQQGKIISIAEKQNQYRILLVSRQNDGSMHQGNPNWGLVKVIAILECCHKLAYIAERAIIKENVPFSEIFQACGATVVTEKDLKADRFICRIGDAPTHSIMLAVARAGCAIVWKGEKKIAFTRLRDLFQQKPAEILETDSTHEIKSGFIERHEIPAHYTNQADGSIMKSSANSGRRADFELFADQQILNNLSTYLEQRRIWTTGILPNLNAGDVVEVVGKKYVVITAVHAFSKSGSGSGSQMSRFWLGELSDNIDKQQAV